MRFSGLAFGASGLGCKVGVSVFSVQGSERESCSVALHLYFDFKMCEREREKGRRGREIECMQRKREKDRQRQRVVYEVALHVNFRAGFRG